VLTFTPLNIFATKLHNQQKNNLFYFYRQFYLLNINKLANLPPAAKFTRRLEPEKKKCHHCAHSDG
jgi:hypothetical protein